MIKQSKWNNDTGKYGRHFCSCQAIWCTFTYFHGDKCNERNREREKNLPGMRLRVALIFAWNLYTLYTRHAFSVWQLHFFHKCDVMCVFVCERIFPLLLWFFIVNFLYVYTNHMFFYLLRAAFHFPFCISSDAYCNFVAGKWYRSARFVLENVFNSLSVPAFYLLVPFSSL